MAKRTAMIRNKLQIVETRLTSHTKNFATYATDIATKALKKKMTTLRQILNNIIIFA